MCVSKCSGQATLSIHKEKNENQSGFLSKIRKKAPDWSTSFSIEGLSFFLFTPSLKRKPGEGEGKKWKETKKKLRKEKRKKEKGKTERKKEACDKPSPNAGNTFGKQQIDSKN